MPTLGPGRKRYSITMTQANVERFQSLCRTVGLPATTLSRVCDDAVVEVSNIFDTALQQGKFDLQDIFRIMGKQVELLIEEERKENALHKERLASAPRQEMG